MVLTWRNVFDTNHKHWGHVDKACEFVKASGYKYMCWNGSIFDIQKELFTGLTIRDINKNTVHELIKISEE